MDIKKRLKRIKIRWKINCQAFYLGYLRGRYTDWELDWVVSDKVFDCLDKMKSLVQQAENLDMISHEKAAEFYAIGA